MLLVSRGKTPFLSTLLFSCFLLFSACQKDAVADLAEAPIVPEERSYPGVDERLWPYFQRFEEDLFREFKRSGIDYVSIATEEDYIKPLIHLFKNR